MPNQPKSPVVSARVPAWVKSAYGRLARERGETVSVVAARALEDYLDRQGIRPDAD